MRQSTYESFKPKQKPDVPPLFVPFAENVEPQFIYNTQLLHNCIVTIPRGMYCPKRYDDRGGEVEHRVGKVVEVYPNLVAVQFFGYPNTVDYTLREALEFEVNAHCSRVEQFFKGCVVTKLELQ